jgi:2-iminobutanoate/2-iminopropanoate deaminase
MSVTARNSAQLPKPVGPFSHLVSTEALMFFSGQIAQDPATGKLIEGDVGAQAKQILGNIGLLLREFDRSFRDVVKVNVFLISMKDFAAMNEIYASTFSAPYPARTTVAVAELPLGARIEIEVVVGRS